MKGRYLAVMALPLLLFTQIISRPPASSRPTEVGIGASGISFGGRSTLHQGLVMHLPLNELSGTRVNVAGTCGSDCNATAVGAPGAGGGAGSYGLQLTGGANQALTVADNASLSLGADTAFTVATRYRPDALSAATKTVVSKVAPGAPNNEREFLLWVADNAAHVSVGNGAANTMASSLASIAAGTRSLIVAAHDPAANQLKLSVGGAAYAVQAWANGTRDGTGALEIGRHGGASGYSDVNATVDVAALWKDVSFTQEQVTTLYNSGKGMDCAAIATSGLPQPTACWDLNEASGIRYASTVGTCTTDCNLSAVAAPGRTAGLVENGMGMGVALNGTNQSLTIADNAALSSGGKSFSAAVWVLTTSATARYMLQKAAADPEREWLLYADGGLLKGAATPTGNVADYVFVQSAAGAVPLNTWTLCYLQFDRNAQKIGVAANDAAVALSVGTLSDVRNGSSAFVVGNGGTFAWTGSIDAVSYYDRTLTLTERTALYSAGMGVPWPWTSLADGLLSKPLNWADRSDESKQRAVYAYTGVVVPSEMLPFRSRKVYVR
jgi:hypothetical protein